MSNLTAALIMRRKFILPIKGLSINSTYHNDKRHGMTASAREWFATVEHLLAHKQNALALAELRDKFDPTAHAYFFQIKSYVPADIYYTKEGKLSRRSFDISNVEKSIVDVFCLEKYTNSLRTDDCVVQGCHSIKLPSSDGTWRIEVSIKIISNGRAA